MPTPFLRAGTRIGASVWEPLAGQRRKNAQGILIIELLQPVFFL
jgi:hypothetical protein